jgi:iron transport multicopper oxidase
VPDITSSITYNSSAPLASPGTVDEYHDVNDTFLVPLEVIAQPPVTKTIELEVTFDTMDDGTNHAMFNQITYNPPLVPAVFSALSLGSNATIDTVYGPLSFVVDHLDVVDIVIKNGDVGKHPLYDFYQDHIHNLLTLFDLKPSARP